MQVLWFIICLMALVKLNAFKFDEECYLHVGNMTYDFLRHDGNSWVTVNETKELLGSVSIDFLICRTKEAEEKCAEQSNLCLTQNTGQDILKIAHTANINDVSVDDNVLIFNFKSNLKNCVPDGKLTNLTYFVVTLVISCHETCHKPFIENLNNVCSLSILWRCTLACPVQKTISTDSCLLSLGYNHYDIRALADSNLFSECNERYINLNVCRSAKVYSCRPYQNRVLNDNLCEQTSYNNFQFVSSSSRGLFLIYNSNHDLDNIDCLFKVTVKKKIFVALKCLNGQIKPKLSFIGNKFGNFHFQMETMLVCPKPKTQCKKQINKFSMIDLTPLRKGFRNWLINNNKEKLIFNVGSGLAFQQGFLCSGGSIAACLQKSDGTLINYGDTFDRIEVKSNSVSIFIRNGEQCGSERYSLNITLIEDLNKSNPIIIKNNNCSKDIEWRTPYATAVEYFQGKNCNIKTNIEYAKDLNFTNLFIQDYRLQTEDGTSFRINLCSRLKEKCGQFTDARICWTDEFNKQHAIGLYDEELVLKKRSSEFYIRGESCSKDYPYSEVYFTMACSFYEQELILMAKDGCQFYFYWKTREACIFKDEKPGKCTVEDPNTNNVYNLSALSLTSDNYKIILNITHTLILNICRSLVPQYNNQCNMNSGACLMITSAQSPHSISYQSIAMSDVLNVSNSHGVRLTYLKTMLSDCQLTIDFVCNHIESVKVVNINDKCSYHLIWHTEHACPRKKRANNTINCFATDFHTNQQYDLTSLSTKMYEINGYYVSICQPLFNNSCDKNSSVCTKNSVSYGSFSTKIKVLDNSLMLVYNSTSCKSTVIYFVCGMLEDAPKTLNKVNDCLLVIYWPTPLACLRNAICDNDKDKKFQLPNFYNITVPEGFVYLKICSQLDPHPKIICPGGSAACLVTDSGDQKSLGYPLEKPTRRKDSLVLHYPNGDLCDEKKRLHFSTNITLVCNQDKKEDGVHFKELYNCQYKFEWQTTLACETEHKQTLHECLLPSGKQRDMLNHFFTNGIHNIYIDDLYISLCDTKSLCSADVCIKKADQFIWKPFGNLFFNTVLSDNHDTSILYKPFKSDLQCFGKVTLSCDTSIGKGPKIISMVPDCSFEVLWNTPLACDVTEISDSVNNDNFTMSDSKGWWVAGIALSTTIFVSYTALILCRRIKRTQRETNIESLPMLPVP